MKDQEAFKKSLEKPKISVYCDDNLKREQIHRAAENKRMSASSYLLWLHDEYLRRL